MLDTAGATEDKSNKKRPSCQGATRRALQKQVSKWRLKAQKVRAAMAKQNTTKLQNRKVVAMWNVRVGLGPPDAPLRS
eukprot:5386179-Amphidinium_carterae.1